MKLPAQFRRVAIVEGRPELADGLSVVLMDVLLHG
jgi:hypothetical protein